MARPRRIAKGGLVYHVLNRANGRLRIFKKDADFAAFEQILGEAQERFGMRICGYCVMGTHWHLVLWPRKDGELSAFMKWLTGTHSHRWHGAHRTAGIGHLYQGRYKSFPVQDGAYYLTLLRYVESNPLRTQLAECSRHWPWSSLAIRYGADKPVRLSEGPAELPKQWKRLVDLRAHDSVDEIQTCIDRGRPLGEGEWMRKTAGTLGLEAALRPIGRPKKETEENE